MRQDWCDLKVERQKGGSPYLEFLRRPSMSAGIYEIPAGGVDRQKPHEEDEIYYVVSGKAQFFDGNDDVHVEAGTVLFVPAKVEHRFHSIAEDLSILVVFAPAETQK